MKKIAIVCKSLSRGGAERVTVRLSDYIYNSAVDVSIITIAKGNEEYFIPEGVKRYSISDSEESCSYFSTILKIRKIIRVQAFDTVLVMGVPLLIYLLLVINMKNVRVIVSERGNPYQFTGKKIVQKVALKLMRYADGYVFQTEGAKSFFGKHIQKKAVVIPNPLISESLPEVYRGERERLIVSVGRLMSVKNHNMLITAFSQIADKYSDYKLVIYGEGVLREELEEYINDIGLSDRILLPGNKENVLDLIKSASLFVFTSNSEGMPNALIEAMALGLPCVSTDCPCGGPKELITDGENGYLVPVGDVDSLVKQLTFILENRDCAEKIARNAVKIRDRLDIKIIGAQWLNYLRIKE